MDCVILIDNSNLYIEGQKCSAKRKGMLPEKAGDKQPMDISWRIEFSRLLTQLANGRTIKGAVLVGSKPPPNDEVWKMAERAGFKVITHDRDRSNKEKAVDAEIAARGALLIAKTPAPAVLVIGSGDRDFIPLVNLAHEEGWTVEMAAFSSAYSPTGQMATSVDKVRPLDGSLDLIGHCAFEWPEKKVA
jgi:uncharacterized LabA/DUF88 family protein